MTRNSPAETVGIVVGHGSLPGALRDAALEIVGSNTGLEVVSNVNLESGRMDELLEQAVRDHPGSKMLVFVDLYGSSCSQASARLKRAHPGVAVICGVNLPMLVRFLYYRTKLDFARLVELMHQTGIEEIKPGQF